jgi:chromosome segregation ATPase
MDLDQVAKRLEWLDNERRKDKETISSLEERLTMYEGNIPALSQQIKELASEFTRMAATLGRLDQIEATIAQSKVDFGRSVDSIEKARLDRDREVDKSRRTDFESLTMSIAEVRKGLEPIPDLKKGILARTEEGYRLGRLIEELEQKITETRRSTEDFRRSQRLLEESQKQDIKRLTDIQGEVAAVRKRTDEQRGKIEVTSESVRKYDMRINELLAAEAERRQTQVVFLEKLTLWQVERDRAWKEVQSNFESITKQAINLDSQLQALDATHRQIKRSQEGFDEITTRFERRINEITEMQRLVEERFRQEWVAYKADDQKRWMNYSLSQEEQQREMNRLFDKNEDRIVTLEDTTQEVRDLVHQINEETLKRLQGFLAVAHGMMEDYDRVFGR